MNVGGDQGQRGSCKKVIRGMGVNDKFVAKK